MDAEPVGWLAASLTLLAFSQRSMLHLRIAAIGSNLSFITYGVMAHLYPVMALHLLLLPCNAFRLIQLLLLRSGARDVRREQNGGSEDTLDDRHFASPGLEQQIRQPLTAAMIYSQVLVERVDNEPERQAIQGLVFSIRAIEDTLASSVQERGCRKVGPTRRLADRPPK